MVSADPSKLETWDTEFSDVLCPSAILLCNTRGDAAVVVGPHGVDKYPKYLLRFNARSTVGYKCEDEGFALNKSLFQLRSENHRCTYKWVGSPWLDTYHADHVEIILGGKLTHYVIIGGDFIVEIISTEGPLIEKIESKTSVFGHKV